MHRSMYIKETYYIVSWLAFRWWSISSFCAIVYFGWCWCYEAVVVAVIFSLVLLTLQLFFCCSSSLLLFFREINLVNTTNTDTGTGMQCELSAFFFSLAFHFVYRRCCCRLSFSVSSYSLSSFYLNGACAFIFRCGCCVFHLCMYACLSLSLCVFFYRKEFQHDFSFLLTRAIIGFYSIFCTNMSSAFFIQGWN